MAKVYSPPKSMPCPAFNVNAKIAAEQEMAFLRDLKQYCVEHGKGPHRGKEIYFTVGDGTARYMVFNDTSLIHLALDDGYSLPLAHERGLSKSDITSYVALCNPETPAQAAATGTLSGATA